MLRKKWVMQLIFLHADKHGIGMVKHSQISQNSKLECLDNLSTKYVRDKVDFLYVDRHHNFL